MSEKDRRELIRYLLWQRSRCRVHTQDFLRAGMVGEAYIASTAGDQCERAARKHAVLLIESVASC